MTPTPEPKESKRKVGRGYSWPDAENGNVMALVHGARSPRVVDAVAAIIADGVKAILAEGVLKDAPWLGDKQGVATPIFEDAIWRYARAEARARLLSNHIFSLPADKVGSRLWESANGADNTASKMAEALGLTPLSRAKLAALVTSTEATNQGIERLAAQGSAIHERAIREGRAAALKAVEEEEN